MALRPHSGPAFIEDFLTVGELRILIVQYIGTRPGWVVRVQLSCVSLHDYLYSWSQMLQTSYHRAIAEEHARDYQAMTDAATGLSSSTSSSASRWSSAS
eukprot:5439452-Pyramimonas_sp.AAC.1